MKGRASHQQSTSKPKQQKQPSKSKHEVSVSNIKHKTSQVLYPIQSKKMSTKTQASRSKSRDREAQNLISQTKSKQSNKLRSTIKESCQITHLHSKDKMPSNTNTDRRKLSIKTHHKTEMNYDEGEIGGRIQEIKNSISGLDIPEGGVEELRGYYRRIKEIIGDNKDPFHELLRLFHRLYTNPIFDLLDQVEPYQHLILKRKELCGQINTQLQLNKELFQQINCNSERLQISKLEQIVIRQRAEIEERKRNLSVEGISDFRMDEDLERIQMDRKEFRIDLGGIRDQKVLGYHDEFMSHLAQMSESWRHQIQKQKRY